MAFALTDRGRMQMQPGAECDACARALLSYFVCKEKDQGIGRLISPRGHGEGIKGKTLLMICHIR